MFGHKHREERKAEEAAAKKAHDEAELHQAMVNLIGIAEGQDSTDPDWPLVVRHGERLVSSIQGCGLFEPRRGPGHWEGRSAGVSVPIPDTRIRVRVGKSAGTFVQGAEAPTVIDTGNATITTERIVFQGEKYTREWEFSKLIGISHYTDRPATAIQVSNRQKTSGIVVAGPSPEPWRLAMTVAIAIFHGEAQETVKELRDELAKLDAETTAGKPSQPDAAPTPTNSEDASTTPPISTVGASQNAAPTTEERKPDSSVPTPPSTPPPMWAVDPSGRHQFRWWDGAAWSDYVDDNGKQSRDPLPSEY